MSRVWMERFCGGIDNKVELSSLLDRAISPPLLASTSRFSKSHRYVRSMQDKWIISSIICSSFTIWSITIFIFATNLSSSSCFLTCMLGWTLSQS